jgi:hypothetical protein
MDERSILDAQIQALFRELELSREMLPRIGPYLPVDKERDISLARTLDRLFRERLSDLDRIRKDLDWLPIDDKFTDRRLEKFWHEFYQISQEVRPLIQECLALMEGVLVRQQGLDHGLCAIADNLLYDLSDKAGIYWRRFTVLDEGEYFGHMAQIIRLRFPEESVWNLPVAAHEFGHFVASEVPEVYELLEREMDLRGPMHRNLAEELFADLFATYALGPAYACTSIILRFDPVAAYQEGYSHPSFDRRVRWILKVLEMIEISNSEYPWSTSYRQIRDHLQYLWHQILAATQQEEVEASVKHEFEDLLHELYRQLEFYFDSTIRFDKYWDRAVDLSYDLVRSKEIPALSPEHTVVDVLNAAWIIRMGYQDSDDNKISHQPAQVSDRALELCKQVIEHRDRRRFFPPEGPPPGPVLPRR